jgi:spermidine/putrescine transport system permease protein
MLRWLGRNALRAYTGLALVYLLLPIFIVALFSFNDPVGKTNYTWVGFTFDHWVNLFAIPGLLDSVVISIRIAFISTLIATTLGTLAALALVRYQFRGRPATSLFIFLPLATPEIILGASLLTLFVAIGKPPFFPLNEFTILIAHITFNISYVIVTVRARLAGFDRRLEEASADLGADGWQTFWRVTFPLILPGIAAAGLLAFSLSIDDFVITNFTAGRTITFPMFVWGSARIGVPPQVNAIGTIFFVVAVSAVAVGSFLQRRRV